MGGFGGQSRRGRAPRWLRRLRASRPSGLAARGRQSMMHLMIAGGGASEGSVVARRHPQHAAHAAYAPVLMSDE